MNTLPPEFSNYLIWAKKTEQDTTDQDLKDFLQLTTFASINYPQQEITKEIFLHWRIETATNLRATKKEPTEPKLSQAIVQLQNLLTATTIAQPHPNLSLQQPGVD